MLPEIEEMRKTELKKEMEECLADFTEERIKGIIHKIINIVIAETNDKPSIVQCYIFSQIVKILLIASAEALPDDTTIKQKAEYIKHICDAAELDIQSRFLEKSNKLPN